MQYLTEFKVDFSEILRSKIMPTTLSKIFIFLFNQMHANSHYKYVFETKSSDHANEDCNPSKEHCNFRGHWWIV